MMLIAKTVSNSCRLDAALEAEHMTGPGKLGPVQGVVQALGRAYGKLPSPSPFSFPHLLQGQQQALVNVL